MVNYSYVCWEETVSLVPTCFTDLLLIWFTPQPLWLLLLSATKSTFLNIFLLPQGPRPLITQNAAVLASIIQSRTFRFIRPVGIRLPLICCQTSDQRVVGIERWAVWLFPLIWPWAATCAEVSSLQIPDVSRPLWCMHRWKPRRIFSNNLEVKESILLSDWLFIRPWCQS